MGKVAEERPSPAPSTHAFESGTVPRARPFNARPSRYAIVGTSTGIYTVEVVASHATVHRLIWWGDPGGAPAELPNEVRRVLGVLSAEVGRGAGY